MLTSRDKELFTNLMQNGILSTSLIAQIQFNNCSKKALLRRLNILEKAGFIRRVRCQAEMIWLLTNKGASVIGQEKSFKTRINMNSIEHDLLLVKIQFKFMESGVTDRWELEHCLRHRILSQKGFIRKENLILPDGICIVDRKGQKESLAVELELNQKDKSRYRKIFRSYQKKESLFGIWYLVKNKRFGNYLSAIWEAENYCHNNLFLFSTIDEVLDSPTRAKVYTQGDVFDVEEIFLCQKYGF